MIVDTLLTWGAASWAVAEWDDKIMKVVRIDTDGISDDAKTLSATTWGGNQWSFGCRKGARNDQRKDSWEHRIENIIPSVNVDGGAEAIS